MYREVDFEVLKFALLKFCVVVAKNLGDRKRDNYISRNSKPNNGSAFKRNV